MKSDMPISNKDLYSTKSHQESVPFADRHMPPVREESKNRGSLTDSLEEYCTKASFESSLPLGKSEQALPPVEEFEGATQDHVMPHDTQGACASSKVLRPEVTSDTTQADCRICGSAEDNIKTNFSYLKENLDTEDILDFIIQKKRYLTKYQTEDITSERLRRRRVDVLMKKLLHNGPESCQCLMDALLSIEEFQFVPKSMHNRHLQRSKITVVKYAIESRHLKNETDDIVKKIDPEEIADLLVEEYVISPLDHEAIVNPQYHKNRITMATEMVTKLVEKDQNELNLFLYALEHAEHLQSRKVAEKLQNLSGIIKQKSSSFFGLFSKTKKDKSFRIQTTDKSKEAVANMKSTNVSLKLSFSDGKGKSVPGIEDQVLNTFRENKDDIDELADAFAKLSIKDFEKGSIVIHFQLESVRHVNRFRYAVSTGDVENFVNRLLESANIHKLIPKDGLNVEVDVIINEEEGTAEELKGWSTVQRCIVNNMAYLIEELNPFPVMRMYQEKQFLSKSEIDTVLKHQTNRRLQVQTLLNTILAKEDGDVDRFFSILQSGKQVYLLDRIKRTRCADCMKEQISNCKDNLLEELDSITIRDTLDRCEHVPYELYSDPESDRKDRIHKFLNFLLQSNESLFIFDDVLFTAGLSFLLEGETSASKGHLCSRCYYKENDPTKEVNKKKIEENYDKLTSIIKAADMIDALVERGALTYREKAAIFKEKTMYKTNMSLLDFILKNGPNSCSKFADVIQEQEYDDQSVYAIFQVEYAGGGRIDEKPNAPPKERLPTEPPFEYSAVKLVAAIDFGTTYSGYAYSYIGERSISRIQTKRWKASGDSTLVSLKAPSSLLLKRDRSFEAFGFEANERYFELAEEDSHFKWHYFKQFKMLLHNKPDLRRDTKIVDDQGHELNALDVFSHSIRYLKEDLVKHVNDTKDGKDVVERDIYWVLTVPAIWDEPAKQFMREAAHLAGIQYFRLTLALEPEAAAIYVKQISIHREEEVGSKSPTLSCFKPGAKYVVLDVGGGTVDATVSEVLPDNTLQELHEASGGEWGGQKVNEAIHSLFKEVFGLDVMKKFESENKADFLELDLAIETTKRNVQSAKTDKLDIRIPDTLIVTFTSLNTGVTVPVVAPKYTGKIEVKKNNRIRIDKGLFKELFNPCIDNIIKHAKSILKEERSKGVEYMICVGGFSECEYLQNELRQNFPDLKVITPPDAGLAVLKGAVLYGQTPGVVKARISRFTYGTAMHRYFIKDYDDESKLVYHDRQPYCKDVFHKLAEAGSSYSVGYKVEEDVHPVTANMTKMSVKIYRSTSKNPKYVTDENCTYMGRMVVDMPDTRGGLNRTVVVSLIFGDTELMAEGLDKSTQKKVHVSLDLLS